MKEVKTRCQFTATACHSGSVFVSLYLISVEFDGRGAEGEGGPFMHCELHVHGVDDLVRDQHEVLADVDVLQCKRGGRGGARGRVQQDNFRKKTLLDALRLLLYVRPFGPMVKPRLSLSFGLFFVLTKVTRR